MGRHSDVFTRSTWTAVGVLVTLAALQTGRSLPAVDPAAATGAVAALAWVVVGLVVLAERRARRPMARSRRARATT